jgi:2-polyprenyl-3-methyl-5-hydroxy-6-metoxy-1,4-benzoquinol methylase
MSLLLDERKREVELMDDPNLDQAEHLNALQGLSRLNWASRSTCIVWQPIRELSRRLEARRLCVLDVGLGAGDVLLGLWSTARRRRLDLELHGMDISGRAIQYARERSRTAGASITYSQIDALE